MAAHKISDTELMLRCSCNSRAHVAYLIFDPADSRGNNIKEEDDDWYLGMALDCQASFWRRARYAVKYLFRPSSETYREVVLKNKDMADISNFIRGICLDTKGNCH